MQKPTMQKKIFYIMFAALAIAACKKVINVDLNNAAPQIVIEGEITNELPPYQVRISKTVNFSAKSLRDCMPGPSPIR